MIDNKYLISEMLRDKKNLLPNFYALEKNGSYLVYKSVSYIIEGNPVNVINLEEGLLIESVVNVPKGTIDKNTHVTLARSVDKKVYSMHRWIYTLKALKIKCETGQLINIIEFK
jgi:hypothetical protein